MFVQANAQDRQAVIDQLGRLPQSPFQVAVRDQHSNPTVIRNYPLIMQDTKPVPFPTTYWLVDPQRATRISQLESQGIITQLETELHQSPEMQQNIQLTHQRAGQERWDMLTADEKALAQAHKIDAAIRDRGVAGIEDWQHLKCLHAWLADHLVHGNAVGERLSDWLK